MRAPSPVFVSVMCLGAVALSACPKPSPARVDSSTERSAAWQLVAENLPEALLSVSARSSTDVYAVGSDKGHGPLALHFDGKAWHTLDTGHIGDLWWVQAIRAVPF